MVIMYIEINVNKRIKPKVTIYLVKDLTRNIKVSDIPIKVNNYQL